MSDSNEKCENCCVHEKKCNKGCGLGFSCNNSFFFVRWIFGFIILTMIFCTGILIGKFAGQIERGGIYGGFGNSGYSKMMRYDNNYGYPIIMRDIQSCGTTEITPATSKPLSK